MHRDDEARDGLYAHDDKLSSSTAPTRSAGAARGLITQFATAVGAAVQRGPALRLDDGTWIIKAARLLPDLEVAAAPAVANPTFPIILSVIQGIGGVSFVDSIRVPARGLVLVRQFDAAQVQLGAEGTNAGPESVLLVAQKLLSPPVPAFVEATAVVGAGGTGTFNVPQGAVRVSIYGAAGVALAVTFLDAAGAGKAAGTILGANAAQETGILIPATCAQVAVGPIAAGATITVVWEVIW